MKPAIEQLSPRILLLLFLIILISDQLTKHWVVQRFSLGQSLEVIPGYFDLTLVYNKGAAFGIFSGLADFPRRLALIGVSVLALLIVLRFMLKEAQGDDVTQGALVSILAGAVGNIIDRIRFDAVVDFLDVYWKTYHWPAFNIADSAISVGVVTILFRMLFAGTTGQKEV